MSASVGVLQQSGVMGQIAEDVAPIVIPSHSNFWRPEAFAREQIRGLVRRVFFMAGATSPIRQVAFCAAEPQLDIAPICDQVARTLAQETCAQVALMGHAEESEASAHPSEPEIPASIKSAFNQLAPNLWYVTRNLSSIGENPPGTAVHWVSCLTELRKEFEYVVIEGPAAGISSEATLLGQMTDGLILVLGAHSTRKATAQKIKQTLQGAQSRILGSVLSDRRFPIPEGIYNRL